MWNWTWYSKGVTCALVFLQMDFGAHGTEGYLGLRSSPKHLSLSSL